MSHFAKRYRQLAAMEASVRHHDLLRRLGAPVPDLLGVDKTRLTVRLSLCPGHEPRSADDLAAVAAALGRLHRAYATRAASEPVGSDGVAAFWPRRGPLIASLAVSTPGGMLTAADVPKIALLADAAPVALYKDTNCRNVLVNEGAVTFLDFDQLSRAPIGYDLAKLVVSAAMTTGAVPDLNRLQDVYVTALGLGPTDCFSDLMTTWCAVHDLLTARYLGRNAYRHRWATVIGSAGRAALASALATGHSGPAQSVVHPTERA